MDPIDQEFGVRFHYPVHFTRGVFGVANPVLRHVLTSAADHGPADFVAIVDDGVARAHPALVEQIENYVRASAGALTLAAPVLIVPGGEIVKNEPRHLEAIHRTIHDGRLCRHSYVVVIGGGAVLDAAGYAAATAHRGVRLVRVPTTVLAQDDSAVGVKNGVNGFGKKNYYGTFAPPYAVINDLDFLSTLLDRDWLGGLSEAVKVALIKDGSLFDHLERAAAQLVARDPDAMETVVRRSAALHLAHISRGGDPFELTSSRPLDFGHWAAHKLEQMSAHRLRHGEAVGIGIALDTTYSWLTGALSETDWRRVVDLLIALHMAVHAPELDAYRDEPNHVGSVFAGLAEFREHLGGQLTVMLLRSIGQTFDVHDIDTSAMIRSIDVLKQVEAARSTRVVDHLFAGSTSRSRT